MTAQRRNLKDYFDAARAERSPMSADAARSLVSDAAAPGAARSPFMSPALLATSAAAIIAAAGVTVKVIHDNDKKPATQIATTTSISAPPSATPPAMSQPGGSAPEPVLASVVPSDDGGADGTNSQRTVRIVRSVTSNDDGVMEVDEEILISPSNSFAVFALKADAEMYRSLGLEPAAVQSICKNLAGADSVVNCSPEHPEPQMKVCVFKEGCTDEVVFMDRPGPMPVMFTSADGRGKVVGANYRFGVDPNKLVPVAAEGCGSNMLMWFEPTEEFVFSMPDSLGEELEQVIDMELRIETKDGKTTMIQKQRQPDGTVTEEITQLGPTEQELELLQNNVEVLRWTMDSTMRSLNIDSIIQSATANAKLGMDSARKTMQIIMKQRHVTMDSMLREMDVDMRELDVDIRELDVDLRDMDLDMRELGKGLEELRKSMKEMKHQFRFKLKNDSGKVHRFEFQSAPNVRRRVIILTSSVRVMDDDRADATAPEAPVMLQESRFGEGAVVSTNVYPNPTSDGGATIAFDLSEPRTLSVELLSLSGETVMQLADRVDRSSGSGQLAFPLNGVAPGMYLVSLTTEQGERAVQRLIVQ